MSNSHKEWHKDHPGYDCEYNEDDNIITDDELADCDTPDETWREGGIKD